ncbi:hypothetical protein [Pedobacter sp. JCM 36344]|uniref:hypothetical protein n=1 Tax=Pedobacter sp. JCM 36344 TaxID=3374280 RepID=UPI00397AAB3A
MAIGLRREGAVTDIYVKSIIRRNYLEVVFIGKGQLTHSGISFSILGLHKYLNDGLINPNMGLFMVKRQIEVLGGTFQIKSDLNIGTEFNMLFPLKRIYST